MKSLLGNVGTVLKSRSNRLFYGDNLDIMRNLPSGCFDLIYLDPPFSSQRTYNLIYTQMTGLPVPEQEEAFCDAWRLDEEKEAMVRRMPIVLREYGADDDLVHFWMAWIKALKHTQEPLLAYLVYMTYRLLEMRRLLNANGSLYLHCDPTASHYIKVIMDSLFGHQNFRNEIIWRRTGAHGRAKRWGPIHDTLIFYTKSSSYIWNRVFEQYDESYLRNFYRLEDEHGRYQFVTLDGPGERQGDSGKPWRGVDPTLKKRHWELPPDRALPNWFVFPDGYSKMTIQERLDVLDIQGLIYWPQKGKVPRYKRYLSVSEGNPIQDIISDIRPVGSQAKERLGYPTQKPLALLERIIRASSNEGQVVFDPFCGCGTSIFAAHQNNRKWIGCDIAIHSVRIVKEVLLRRYGLVEGKDYEVNGVPRSVDAAHELFSHSPKQFEQWAVEMAGGFKSAKPSGDRGIDGRIYYETREGLRSMILSVKGGHLVPQHTRELRGTLERETDADLGGLICLENPTKGMWRDVADAGMFTYLGRDYPVLQIRTIEDLFNGKGFETPSRVQIMNWERQINLPLPA